MGSASGDPPKKAKRRKSSGKEVRKRGHTHEAALADLTGDGTPAFEGGQPEPEKDLPIQLGEDEYLVVRREWITRLVVVAAIAMVPMSLIVVLLGVPGKDVALATAAASAGLLILLKGVVAGYFRK
jgi:hypothetical protein